MAALHYFTRNNQPKTRGVMEQVYESSFDQGMHAGGMKSSFRVVLEV
jgi:hypothetical protein